MDGRIGSGAVREARAEDAGAIVDLWTEAYVTRGVGGRTLPYELEDFELAVREGEVSVVERGGRVAGVVVLRGPEAEGRVVARPDEAELSRLAVSYAARRAGIGGALVDFCTRLAREAGWAAIALWSRSGQVEAHRLYAARGYRRAPERDWTDASGQARLVFRLEL